MLGRCGFYGFIALDWCGFHSFIALDRPVRFLDSACGQEDHQAKDHPPQMHRPRRLFRTDSFINFSLPFCSFRPSRRPWKRREKAVSPRAHRLRDARRPLPGRRRHPMARGLPIRSYSLPLLLSIGCLPLLLPWPLPLSIVLPVVALLSLLSFCCLCCCPC